MKLKLTVFLLQIVLFLTHTTWAMAITDPLATTNNKIGIHVLDHGEIEMAAKLVNNDGKAEWGYVTVPMQAGDRDRKKWGEFMKRAKELKVIPLIRVATVPEGSNWVTPNNFDLIDFANFLNDLDWPTKNRYVIIFNEVNHGAEYGGFVSPEHYAQILINAVSIFKSRNEDFFILPSAMDNATISNGVSLNWRSYLQRMWSYNNDVFTYIDGWNSHAYPNPGFAGRVTDRHDHSVRSYLSDLAYVERLSGKRLPVFITEAGWDSQAVGEVAAANNLRLAYEQVWSDNRIVAVTPFLLRAGDGPFVKFSFLNQDGSQREIFRAWQSLATTKGQPALAESYSPNTSGVTTNEGLPPSNSDSFSMHISIWKKLFGSLDKWFKM